MTQVIKETWPWLVILTALILFEIAAAVFMFSPARAHDIYTGVKGKDGQLCCGSYDCALTTYRERGAAFEFLTREKEWVAIPIERVTFLPIPGDETHDDTHAAHLCYRPASDNDRHSDYGKTNVFGTIYLYCVFIPPGAL